MTALGGGLHMVNPSTPSAVIRNCRFFRNGAFTGGAISAHLANMHVVNCVFVGNYASMRGGAVSIQNTSGDCRLINCTMYGNTSDEGGSNAVYLFNAGSPLIGNCAFYGSFPEEFTSGNTSPVQMNNIYSTTLLFVDPDGADNVVGTLDDNLRLQQDSPCVDSGTDSVLPTDESDLDSDGDTNELLPIDLDLAPRVADGNEDASSIVDMGAYEFIPPKAPPCPADLTGPGGQPDGQVNVSDLFLLLANWNTAGAGATLAPPDDVVNVADLFVLLAAWGDC
jgi:hypothetical protein